MQWSHAPPQEHRGGSTWLKHDLFSPTSPVSLLQTVTGIQGPVFLVFFLPSLSNGIYTAPCLSPLPSPHSHKVNLRKHLRLLIYQPIKQAPVLVSGSVDQAPLVSPTVTAGVDRALVAGGGVPWGKGFRWNWTEGCLGGVERPGGRMSRQVDESLSQPCHLSLPPSIFPFLPLSLPPSQVLTAQTPSLVHSSKSFLLAKWLLIYHLYHPWFKEISCLKSYRQCVKYASQFLLPSDLITPWPHVFVWCGGGGGKGLSHI